MLCDNCKERDAVVHVSQTILDEANNPKLLHLCERCAAAHGVETTVATPKHPLADFLHEVHQKVGTSAHETVRCTFCNSTLADFRTTGRWGCARCYTNFEPTIRELLRRVHGNHRHVGRSYEPPPSESLERASALGDLRDKLRRAIDNEQFELAADLRDRIRSQE
jgi:protein arginine kinase activator